MKLPNLFAETNRGMLLDVVVFLINLILMNLLTGYSIDLIRLAGEDDPLAQLALLLCSAAMFALPATGAVLKRWHFHQRRSAQANEQPTTQRGFRGKAKMRPLDPFDPKSKLASGCVNVGFVFSAIFYFCLSIFLSSVVMSLLQTLIFGKAAERAAFFVPLVIVSFVLCVVQTSLVYRYFFPPKKAPRGAFWRDPRSEQIGDLCIFANMILFQVFWNVVIGQFPWLSVRGVSEFAGNLFFLTFIALLIYFPPRIFFLAEDFGRRSTWITMFLANSPTILRILFGRNQMASW